MGYRAAALAATLLLTLPALSGCTTVLDRNRPDELRLTLGLALAEGAPGYEEDPTRAAELAARQLNDLEGVLSITTERVRPTPGQAGAAVDELIRRGAIAIVASGSEEDLRAMAARAQGRAILLPATTNATLPSATGEGLVLRVAPDEQMHAAALAGLAEREGAERVVVFAVDDAYGRGLAGAFSAAHAGEIVRVVPYAPQQAMSVVAAGRGACQDAPEGVVLLSYPRDAGLLVRGLQEGGCLGSVRVFAASTARHPHLVEEAGMRAAYESYAEGVLGVEPASARTAEFQALFEADYGRAAGPFAAEAYDAVMYAALAGLAPHGGTRERIDATATAREVRENLLDVAQPPGARHEVMTRAIAALLKGDEIDWTGYAHDFAFVDREPAPGPYGVWRVNREGLIQTVPGATLPTA